jgi:hypothetical protein
MLEIDNYIVHTISVALPWPVHGPVYAKHGAPRQKQRKAAKARSLTATFRSDSSSSKCKWSGVFGEYSKAPSFLFFTSPFLSHHIIQLSLLAVLLLKTIY